MVDSALFSRLPLLADGGLAAGLRAALPAARGPLEGLNQTHPQAVQELHRAYVQAGAELLRTNTAQANAAALAAHGLAERAEALNNSGSALARAALREPVAGETKAARDGGTRDGASEDAAEAGEAPHGFLMGALGQPPRAGLLLDADWERAYGEQVIYLSDTGVDFFLLHHVTRLADARLLTARIRRASDAPVLAALSLNAAGRTEEGVGLAEAVRTLIGEGADALGLCCGPGPALLPEALAILLETGLPVAVLAGLGVAEQSGTPPPYPGAPALPPVAFADWLAPLAAQGVAILGGCCGAGPAHIRALATALGRVP